MELSAKQVVDLQKVLEEERKSYEPLKELCIDMTNSDRSDIWDVKQGDEQQGKPNHKKRALYDPTGSKGLDIWSNGITGNWMPRDINWFMEELDDRSLREDKVTRKWLQDLDDHLMYTIRNSNYHEQKRIALRDAASSGDAFMFIEEDYNTGKLMMLTPHPREFYVVRDFWGRVIAIHQKFLKKFKEIREEFGDRALTPEQLLEYDNGLKEKKCVVIRAIHKNRDYRPGSLGVNNMPWRSWTVQEEKKHMMKSSGYETLNPVPWSLNRASHEIYGRGIVPQMLTEIITANIMGKDMLAASQQAARPSMVMSTALKHKLDLRPLGVTWVNNLESKGIKAGDFFSRLIDPSGYPFGVDNHQRWQKMIEDRFGVPLFLALNAQDGTQRTAYEVRQMQAERVSLMAPFLGTLGAATDMELDRIYSIEAMAGRAPEPPQIVVDSILKQIARTGVPRRTTIQYTGPLQQLLKQYYEQGSLITTIGNIAEVVKILPDSIDVINGDALMKKILRASNSPEELILSDEDIAQIRQMRLQQEEAKMQAELAAKTSQAIPNLSKKIENDSVLKQMLQAA